MKRSYLRTANFLCAVVCAVGLVTGCVVGVHVVGGLLCFTLWLANSWATVA